LANGTRPDLFTISVGITQQSFIGTDSFELDALAPQTYQLEVRGPMFQTRAISVLVEPGKTTDVGTINVQKGRTLAGTVVANGTPVPDATVYAGRQIFGNGSTNSANFGPMGQGVKQTTTDASGMFSLAGFNDGDLAITAEHPAFGRSKALRIPTDMAGQGELVLELQPFGALSGVLRQNGKPVEGVFVSCQSTTTPGAIYAVASGPDGSYRYDKLAPDTYKVSATVGMPMSGMKFYSKEVVVPSGQEVHVDLAVEPGNVEVDVLAAPRAGKMGVGVSWLVSGTITAHTANELQLKVAAAGAGASQLTIIRNGEAAKFTEVVPAVYSACVVPYPAEVHGMSAMGYMERHGDKLGAYCAPAQINGAPDHQTITVAVDIPPYIPDDQGSGAGSGSGR
ncbi:MAG: carboxypeptidase regulatory-like domain-containing protein, partial [Deltaproteobacteria bacterium]|nr:carboxypeptidase regulatory-like domain-containing protein [Deltaproteobacteria bacterium]